MQQSVLGRFSKAARGGVTHLGIASLLIALLASRVGADLVITEIHYAPVGVGGGARPELEFVEVFNDGPEPYDMTGYQLCRGASYVFADGYLLGGRSYVVICADQAALRAEYGISNTVGNFFGSLDNAGETVELCNPQGVPVSRTSYNDRGQWPSAAKGSGHSLAIKNPYRDSDDPDSWRLSTQLGGTPGLANFNDQVQFVEETIIPNDSTWRYFKGTSNPPSNWRAVTFNDAGWLQGQTGIGYGDNDDRTVLDDMRNGYVSVFCRKSFTIADVDELDEVVLSVSLDDGMVVSVNETEVGRVNMAAGTIDNTTLASATVGDAPVEPPAEVTIPSSALRNGTNVLAVSVHNTSLNSSDVSFVPALVSRRTVLPEAIATVPVRVNEGHFRTGDARFVELYNDSSSAVNLGGFHLTDSFANLTKFVIPAGTSIPARGFVVFTDAQLGFDFSIVDEVKERVEIALVNAAGTRVIDGRIFEPKYDGFSEARFPDGDESFASAATPTPGAANEVPVVRDVVFNEIMYHPISDDPRSQFIEFYNRGSQAHDISGWTVEGIGGFEFPPGTVIAPGEFKVVAFDPARIRADYGLAAPVVLDAAFTGSLSDGGERLRLRDIDGNEADKVRYFDGGEWPRWADGGGSSLEKIDPFAESSVATSWDASDDSAEAQARSYSYTAQHGGGESDFGMTLLAEGITIVDNVSVTVAAGGSNLVSNGTFDANTNGWRIEGTLVSSGRTTAASERLSGAGSLKLIAWNGGGDYKVNRVETDTSAQSQGTTYRISFDAKWQVGSASILGMGYYNIGNPSSAGLAGSTFLAIPRTLGTPGAINSVTQRQVGAFGSANMGPAIDRVDHEPCVPGGSETVTVEARVRDPDGVASVRIFYRTDSVTGTFTQRTMTDPDGDGKFAGTIPGQALGTRVAYYIEATDSAGRVERFPRDILGRSHPPVVTAATAPASDELYCMYRHDTRNPATSFHSYRFVMHEENEQELATRRVLSNQMLEGTFVFGGDDCYYNAQLRFAGSPWLRPGGGTFDKSYALKIPKDDALNGRKTAFNLDEHSTDGKERLAHFLLRRNAGDSRLPYFDFQALVRFQLNDVRTGTYEALDKPNRQYIDFWFPGDSDGPHYEMDDRFSFDDSGNRTGNAEGKVLYPPYGATSLGSDKENYRWYFALRNDKTGDDFQPLLSMCRTMDARTTSNTVFDREFFQVFDVDELLRVWAIELNIDDWDTWGGNRGKNCYFYQAPSDRLWRLVPWDLELTFDQVTRGDFNFPTTPTGAFSNHFTEIARALNRPIVKRKYYGIVKNMLDRFFYVGGNSPLSAYASAVAAAGVGNTTAVTNFVNSRRNYLLNSVNAASYPTVRLTITTNGGADFTHVEPQPFVDLDGESPAQVCSFALLRNGEFVEDLAFEFSLTDLRDFSVDDVPLLAGQNEIQILGFNDLGNVVDSDTIRITSTGGWNAPVIESIEPSSAAAGDRIAINGREFHDGVTVTFHASGDRAGESVEFDEVSSPGTIQVTVPLAVPDGVATVEVRNLDGQTSNLYPLTIVPPPPRFIRGDANLDEIVDISDPVKIVRYLFAGVSIDCEDALDANDDGVLDVTDAILVLDLLYRAGVAPPAPFPQKGEDPSAGDELGCDRGI